jgi:nitrogenase molybdenum-iron protein NifN
MISHYKEPMDIASSSFDESAAVFGGETNLISAVNNVAAKYRPSLIGVATTCLSETMGEDVGMYLKNAQRQGKLPDCEVFHVSTPSYAGTHVDGFFETVRALVDAFAVRTTKDNHIVMIPGMVSPADIRYLKEVLTDFGSSFDIVPDYSDTLDGPIWSEYQPIPKGGTPTASIRRMGDAKAVVELYRTVPSDRSAGALLQAKFGVKNHALHLPIGVTASDAMFDTLSTICGHAVPLKHAGERARLLDAYVDGHKYIFGKRAAVFGDPELVIAMCGFLAEIGIHPVIAGSGTKTDRMREMIGDLIQDEKFRPEIVDDESDFVTFESSVQKLDVDILVGHSKGYGMARRLGIPLIRVGFPIHDRLGGARVLHLGYRGAQQLFDTLCNTFIAGKQDGDDIGYAYM